jgi:hypothetical protein
MSGSDVRPPRRQVQTFLPYREFHQTARVLDARRLGKQRVETLQILNALSRENYGWQNHPAVKMWRGHEQMLAEYGLSICVEWKERGYKDTCYEKIGDLLCAFPSSTLTEPPWLRNVELHISHRSNLVRKDPEYYRKFWPDISGELPYIWPV